MRPDAERHAMSRRQLSAAAADKAVVLLSGGIDSATVLAHSIAQGLSTYALSFDYGQRHSIELQAAKNIAARMQAVRHRVINLDLAAITDSALTDTAQTIPSARTCNEIPATYVPGRNIVFLSLATAWASTLGAKHIMIGANQVDYSGYPDCREDFLNAFQTMINYGTRHEAHAAIGAVDGIHVQAPLLNMTKAEIIRYGIRLAVDYAMTVSCYRADRNARACGDCDACYFRKQGFIAANVPDPTRYI